MVEVPDEASHITSRLVDQLHRHAHRSRLREPWRHVYLQPPVADAHDMEPPPHDARER
jgi:hypothetical protein